MERATYSPIRGVVWIAFVHGLLWLFYYSRTLLGESPALDNRQILLLAERMAGGALPAEPFHRAPLYPFILSWFLDCGLPASLLPMAARLVNLISFSVIAGAGAHTAGQLWSRASAAWLAGLLLALNPVLIFFLGDAFDILPATAAGSLALAALPGWLARPQLRHTLWIGAWLALGAALRSHLLPLALLWPFFALAYADKQRGQQLCAASVCLIASFLLLGLANLKVAGEFRMMPWQGAYNLWTGNAPDAPGRIYAQRIRVDFEESYDNPAKLESIALYERETAAEAPHSIDAMNAHWKGKFLSHLRENPVQWLGLMFRKAYYFLNSYEQYDNKTYGFHKQRHFLLRWNPIHWGLLLLLAVAGTLVGLRDPARRNFLGLAVAAFAIYAAGTILFYTSNRFRLPMLPLMACLGSGIVLLPEVWKTARIQWKLLLGLCLGLTAGIAYSGFFDARKRDTWQEDYALLANAAIRTGESREALRWAELALEANPNRNDMHAVRAQANFNLWALTEPPASLDRRAAESFLEESRQAARTESDFATISGIYLWKLGERQAAEQVWRDRSAEDPLAMACLIWTGLAEPPAETAPDRYARHERAALLEATIQAKRAPEEHSQIVETLDHLLSPLPPASIQ